ncbi:addiction module protein [Prosthecobacter sp.]|uniref:addiction module protein n=1 Tax=Prosthecobacter sp. TaxID=1965333 RepID=UPI00248A7D1B|nr:addiction module protein [Prosthecobacter sp.]MDI1310597.1 addiction module protein [Prosthecobacter sp.]
MSTTALPQSLFSLPVAERVALADRLYASVPEDWQKTVDQAWLDEATRRSEELDADPSLELSHEDFMAGLKINLSHPTYEQMTGFLPWAFGLGVKQGF